MTPNWFTFVDGSGQRWQVNQEGLIFLINCYVRAEVMRRHTKIIEEDGYPWVKTNFDGVKAERWVRGYAMWGAMQFQLGTSGMSAFSKLVELRAATAALNQSVLADHKTVTRKTQAMIDASVSRGEMGVEAARFVRTAAAITLTVLAAPIAASGVTGVSAGIGGTFALPGLTVASTSAGMGSTVALGLGSALTGVGEYHDTGRLGRALVVASASLVCGVFAVGAEVPKQLAIQAGKTAVTREAIAAVILQAKTEAVSAAGLALIDREDAVSVVRKSIIAAAGTLLTGGFWEVLEARKGLRVLAKVMTEDRARVAEEVVEGLYGAVGGKVRDLVAGRQSVELLKGFALPASSCQPFKQRRCLVPATGWYEWQKIDAKTKQPYHFQPAAKPFAFAGVYDTWNPGTARVPPRTSRASRS